MAKFRSKLKRHEKGKTWSKGQSSTSNPEQMKHRLKAKSRFFQPNLSLAPPPADDTTNPGLTFEAVMKHEQRQAYNNDMTVNDVASSLKSFSLNEEDDDLMTESRQGTAKTYKTFASDYSICSNMSFKKLLFGFRVSSELHKEMLAILTALAEIIKERGGNETSTEYFILLMEQIEACSEENELIAGLNLLSMGIKSVPAAVLRKRFGETAQTLMNNMARFADPTNQTAIKCILGSFSTLLRAQDYATWSYSSTKSYLDAILSFTVHIKPKVRKSALHAIVSIVHGSCFMSPITSIYNNEDTETDVLKIKVHPAGQQITKFCLRQLTPATLADSQATVLHVLTLLKDIIGAFQSDDIRSICEQLLSIMTAANIMVRQTCFQTIHALFVSRTRNLPSSQCAQLIAVLYQYRPDRNDLRHHLPWLTVLKEGYVHLASLNGDVCINSLPHLIELLATDLGMFNPSDIVTVSNYIKELIHECLTPICIKEKFDNNEKYRISIHEIITSIDKVLVTPYGNVLTHIISIFATIFKTCGKFFSAELSGSLVTLARRYDTQSVLRTHIEHAMIAAIESMGPEAVLKAVPISNAKDPEDITLERSWMLPLLRQGISGGTFKFFKESILPLAQSCNRKWHTYAEEKNQPLATTYELLCCQLWSLFPGFCRQPADIENFRLIAPTIGNALDVNPEFRDPIFDGLKELIQNDENPEIRKVLSKYSKNFLPRLFNIYVQKPNGTYEADVRKKSLEVIKLYLTKTPNDVLKELYENAKDQLGGTALASFEYDAIFDVIAVLIVVQTCDVIREFFETYIVPILSNEKSKLVSKDEQKLKKQQRKTYELLRDILTSGASSCKKFTRKNGNALQKLLLDAFSTSCTVCRAARLKCLKILIESRKATIYDNIVMKTIPEAVLSYKEFSTRKENISEEIIKMIANLFQAADKINDFIDILTVGLTGDESLITNTIFAFRTVVQQQGKHLTIHTLAFILEQIAVFLVQKSRGEAEASIIFLITFIKVMPSPLVANHLETIMKSLSAMTKDTKRFCRLQIGYLLKKLCKRFTAEELIKFVPGDDEVTHKRLKKIRKQMRRDTRKKINEEKDKNGDDDDSDDEFVDAMEKKSVTIEDILADSDSDLPEDIDEDGTDEKPKSKKKRNTYIREDPEDIVDLADIKSIANILSNRPDLSTTKSKIDSKDTDANRGFKTTQDGRLIIKDIPDHPKDDSSDTDLEYIGLRDTKATKRVRVEDDSSDEEEVPTLNSKKRIKDNSSMRSGKTTNSRYTTGGKGIHRPLDTVSMKSGHTAKSSKSASAPGSAYSSKKAKGDMKMKNKLDPYAYLPLSRNILNKRMRAKHSRSFKNLVSGSSKSKGDKSALKGVKTKITKKK